MSDLQQRFLAEFAGTATLLAGVVGSGIMAAQLAGGNAALALLVNAAATAALLYVLIATSQPVSGAHFNPAVSALFWLRGELPRHEALTYVLAQLVGAAAGVVLAHAMFGLPLLQEGAIARRGSGPWLSEAVATAGLLSTILLARRRDAARVAPPVAAYVFAAYWFTASTAFANPAATAARALTSTYCGIAGTDVAGFVAAQSLGLLVVTAFSGKVRHLGS